MPTQGRSSTAIRTASIAGGQGSTGSPGGNGNNADG